MPVRLLVLVGPTASGKTRLAVDVAHRLGTEIISADSRQVYRGLDIGAGKDLAEYHAVTPPVPYHLIDVADAHEAYSVFQYQRDCYRLLAQRRDSPPLLLVGGSGLLVEAVLRGYRIPNVPENSDLRDRLMQRPQGELVEELHRLDPELFERTDCSTKKRVVRALEIANHAREHELEYSPPPPAQIDYALFAIEVDPEELRRRIDRRLEQRLSHGMIEEVQALLDAGISVERMSQLGLEYREVTAYLTGAKTRDEMVADLRRGIRKFAKRQRTWFRGMGRRGLDVRWIDAGDRLALLNHPLAVGN